MHRLRSRSILCATVLVLGMFGAGCSGRAMPVHSHATSHAAVQQPPPTPGGDTPAPIVSTAPPIRHGKPRQPLTIDLAPDAPNDASCRPRCSAYRTTRLRRERAPWIAGTFQGGKVTIVYEKNQCSGAPDEVVVNGRRIEVFQYYAIDPVPNDHYGYACSTVAGPCGGPCTTVEVPTTARTEAQLDHAGVPRFQPRCSPWPACWGRVLA
jgi:hypothetical protein